MLLHVARLAGCTWLRCIECRDKNKLYWHVSCVVTPPTLLMQRPANLAVLGRHAASAPEATSLAPRTPASAWPVPPTTRPSRGTWPAPPARRAREQMPRRRAAVSRWRQLCCTPDAIRGTNGSATTSAARRPPPAEPCEEGYGGAACSSCLGGYTRNASNHCERCPGNHKLGPGDAACAVCADGTAANEDQTGCGEAC